MAVKNAEPSVGEVCNKALRAVAADLEADLPRVKQIEIRLIGTDQAVYRVVPREGDQQIGGIVSLA